jgi:hypothetical protein
MRTLAATLERAKKLQWYPFATMFDLWIISSHQNPKGCRLRPGWELADSVRYKPKRRKTTSKCWTLFLTEILSTVWAILRMLLNWFQILKPPNGRTVYAGKQCSANTFRPLRWLQVYGTNVEKGQASRLNNYSTGCSLAYFAIDDWKWNVNWWFLKHRHSMKRWTQASLKMVHLVTEPNVLQLTVVLCVWLIANKERKWSSVMSNPVERAPSHWWYSADELTW